MNPKRQTTFKSKLVRFVDKRQMKQMKQQGFRPGDRTTLTISSEIKGCQVGMFVKGDIRGDEITLTDVAKILVKAIVGHTEKKKRSPNPNQRQRIIAKENTTKVSPTKLPDVVSASSTEQRGYYTHEYLRQQHQNQQITTATPDHAPNQTQHQQRQQQSQMQNNTTLNHHNSYAQHRQQYQQSATQNNNYAQNSTGSMNYTNTEVPQQNYQTAYYYQNHQNTYNHNRYYGNQQTEHEPYDPMQQLRVNTNLPNYSMAPEYVPTSNDLLQAAQSNPKDGGETSQPSNESQTPMDTSNSDGTSFAQNPATATPDSTDNNNHGNGGAKDTNPENTQQPTQNTGGETRSMPYGKPSEYCKILNCVNRMNNMCEQFDNTHTHKYNSVGKNIKLSDQDPKGDQVVPVYEDITDDKFSPASKTSKQQSPNINDDIPISETNDYPESVLKTVGLPPL